jgi:Cu+-exporting ATPase
MRLNDRTTPPHPGVGHCFRVVSPVGPQKKLSFYSSYGTIVDFAAAGRLLDGGTEPVRARAERVLLDGDPRRGRPGDRAARRHRPRRPARRAHQGPEILESTRNVDTIVLDKTGTVTTGRMTLVDAVAAAGQDPADVLRIAGALEDASEHPIAQAIARAARDRLGALPAPEAFANQAGLGVEGIVDGHGVLIGRRAFMREWSLRIPAELDAARQAAEALGRTAVVVAWDGAVRGVLVVADTVKPGSAEAVASLRALGLQPVLLTGDNAATARAVAADLGIDEVIAEVLPSEKADVIHRLQGEGRVVAMVGDGVNDAPALAQADLGLAIGTGTDVAIEASDLTLVSGDLRAAADAIRLSRATLHTIKQNLGWAFGYNIAALPLAAAGLLNPLIAAAAMAFSSVSVVANALRLRRFRSARGCRRSG